MEELEAVYTGLLNQIPTVATLLVIALILWGLEWLLFRRRDLGAERRVPRELAMLAFTITGLLIAILMLPMSDSTRSQILSLVGIVLTGVIAFSSTTFVANAMAGLMLRMVKSFRPGDFIRIGEQFGRVTERGLLHTEIQTQDRDLTTFPNLHIITNPVTVVRSSGTIISASVSLGYDIPHDRISTLLREGAEKSGLKDPFVQVSELGDFSVSYRVAGFLTDVSLLLTARSELRKKIMDSLHRAGIEIVSPSFMNQRPLDKSTHFIPKVPVKAAPEPVELPPETLMFDKAEEAAQKEEIIARHKEVLKRIQELEKERNENKDADQEQINASIAALSREAETLATFLDQHRNGDTKK